MTLKVVRHKATAVPPPRTERTIGDDLNLLKSEIAKLTSDVVLEVDALSEHAIGGVKRLITRAGREIGAEINHWHVGTKVFIQPKSAASPRRSSKAIGAVRTTTAGKRVATPAVKKVATPAVKKKVARSPKTK